MPGLIRTRGGLVISSPQVECTYNRVAYSRGTAYEDARRALLAEVSEGTRRVDVRPATSVATS